MTNLITLLDTPEGFRSREVARFIWQLDEQRRRLTQDTRGLTPAELAWQPEPGMNTIGMLLAHIAYAETHLVQVGLLGEKIGHAEDVIGITEEQEGMPLPPGARPSPALEGKDLIFFDDALARARAHTHEVSRKLTVADLDTQIVRPRPDGSEREFNLLRHLQRVMPGRDRPTPLER